MKKIFYLFSTFFITLSLQAYYEFQVHNNTNRDLIVHYDTRWYSGCSDDDLLVKAYNTRSFKTGGALAGCDVVGLYIKEGADAYSQHWAGSAGDKTHWYINKRTSDGWFIITKN